MAGIKEIKQRIESVQQTRKITNAMYLIASTKLRRAKDDLSKTRPYFQALRVEIKRIFRTANGVESHYFYPPDVKQPRDGTYGCLVITADKGLAGPITKMSSKRPSACWTSTRTPSCSVVGEYGRHFFKQHKIPVAKSFLYTAQNPTMDRPVRFAPCCWTNMTGENCRRSLWCTRIWRTA